MKIESGARSVLLAVGTWVLGLAASASSPQDEASASPGAEQRASVRIQYLEIVTPEVDATCGSLEALHGVRFGPPEAGLGKARTAELEGGGRIGVRAPLRASEQPVVRPYVLVDDVRAAVEAAEAAGAQVAHPPLELPGHGTFAIYVQGGIEHGLWQL